MPIRAFLFDAADTLFRVRGTVGAAYSRVAAHHGVAVDPHTIEARFRAAFRAMPPLAFPGVPEDELLQHEYGWWKALVETVFAGERFPDFEAFFRELFDYFACADSWELHPDVLPTLTALRERRLRLGIVSNFDARLLTICDGLGIRSAFDAIVISGRVGYAKPDPRIFTAALAQLRVQAADALHVGDSAREDIAGARAAGMRAILVRRGSETTASPDEVTDLRQLLHALA